MECIRIAHLVRDQLFAVTPMSDLELESSAPEKEVSRYMGPYSNSNIF